MTTDYDTWVAGVDALCVTVVAGRTIEDAARTIALADLTEFPDAASAQEWTFNAENYDRSWLAIGVIDGRTFIWEDNGWQGVTEEVAWRLADGNQLTSMCWNVESDMTFLALRGGAVVRKFDPLFHDDDELAEGGVTGEPLPAEDGLDWEESPRLSGLTALSRVAGTPPVDPAWLSVPGVRFWGHRF